MAYQKYGTVLRSSSPKPVRAKVQAFLYYNKKRRRAEDQDGGNLIWGAEIRLTWGAETRVHWGPP